MQMQQAPDTTPDQPPSAVVRHLGLIKAMAIIMAVLIMAALVVIVVTIYSRLQAGVGSSAPQEVSLSIPAGAIVASASSDGSNMILTLDIGDGQQIWVVSPAGKVKRKLLLNAE
jgi:hypothetical protein